MTVSGTVGEDTDYTSYTGREFPRPITIRWPIDVDSDAAIKTITTFFIMISHFEKKKTVNFRWMKERDIEVGLNVRFYGY